MPETADRLEYFWISGSPYAWRVALTLEVKGLVYDSRLLQSSRGDLKTPAFLALYPRGRVPTLRHGQVVLSESIAIMAYLDRRFPTPPLFGTTPAETGLIWRAISECMCYFDGPVNAVANPIFEGATPPDWDIRLKVVHAELARLEQGLNAREWLAAPTLSAADLATYPFVRFLLRAAAKAPPGLDLGLEPFAQKYPSIRRWEARIEALPGYDRTYPPHWRQ